MKKSEAKDKKVEASPKKKEDKTEDKKPEKTENVQVSAEDKES